MNESLYFDLVSKYFPRLVLSVEEKLNGKNGNAALTYMFRDFLKNDYAADGRWSSVMAEYSRVAADVVALSSPLPVKSRDAIETASGKLPKLGLKFELSEQEMKNIDNLINQKNPNLSIIKEKVFADTPRVISAVLERIEDMFLTGLSTGVALAPRNEGTGIRVSYGYSEKNKFGVKVKWDDADGNYMPLDDISRLIDKATLNDGNVPTHLFVDDTWLNAFYKSKQVREQYAFDMDFVGQNIPILDFKKAAGVLERRWGLTLHRVARTIKTEVNGERENHKPWANGVSVFACDDILGSVVWTDVAEATRPVNGVKYQTADDFILVSKYAKNDPLREYTASQAMAAPIIHNVDRIYVLDTNTVQA